MRAASYVAWAPALGESPGAILASLLEALAEFGEDVGFVGVVDADLVDGVKWYGMKKVTGEVGTNVANTHQSVTESAYLAIRVFAGLLVVGNGTEAFQA